MQLTATSREKHLSDSMGRRGKVILMRRLKWNSCRGTSESFPCTGRWRGCAHHRRRCGYAQLPSPSQDWRWRSGAHAWTCHREAILQVKDASILYSICI